MLLAGTALATTLYVFQVVPVAAQQTWQGAGLPPADYNSAANWNTNDVPNTAGETAVFQAAGTTQVDVSAPVTVSGFLFDVGAQAYTITGAQVTISASGIVNNSGAAQSIANVIAGTASVAQNVGGSLTLSGANTYSGGTIITAGTLSVTGAGTLGDAGGTTALSGAGVLDLSTTTQTQATVTQAGTSTIQSTGGAGGLNVGTYQLTGGTVAAGVTITAATAFDLQAGTVNGILAGAGAATKSTAGIVTLSGANTYSGATAVNAGILSIQDGGALGSTGAGTTVASGATLQIQGGISTAEPLTLSGTGVGATNNGALQSVSGINTASGTVTLAAAARINVDAGSLNVTGQITGGQALTIGGASVGNIALAMGPGDISTLTKDGTGTWALSGANTYTGATTVSAGILAASTAANRFSAVSATTIAAGAGIDLGGFNQQINDLTGSGIVGNSGGTPAVLSTGLAAGNDRAFAGSIVNGVSANGLNKINTNVLTLTGTNTYTGATTITAGTLQIGSGGATGSIDNTANIVNGGTLTFNRDTTSPLTIAAAISGAGAINQVGSGLTNLTGSSAGYTGTTTVSTGTLAINGTFGTGATVNVDGGVLQGSGTIGGTVNVAAGATLAAGNSPGTLTITNLNLTSGSISTFELNQPNVAGGANNDLITVTNNLTIANGSILNLQNAPLSGAYRLYDVGGTFTPGGGANFGFTTLNVTNGAATLYTTPVPAGAPTQVNARISLGGQVVQFWDGTDFSGAGAGAQGGTSTWNNTNTNWTYDPAIATVNDSWQSQVGVFGGTAGTVTIAGTVGAQGLQFTTSGYTITGGTLNLLGDAPGGDAAHTFFNVDAGVTATINSAIMGAGIGLRTRVGTGILQLGGASTYTGETLTDAGTNLVVLGTGSVVGTSAVTNNGTFTLQAGGIVTTAGAVTNNGGATFTTAGTLNTASVTNNGGGTFNLTAGTTTAPTFSNSGTFNSAAILNATTSVTNNAGGSFNLTAGTVTTPTFTNNGTLNSTGGSVATPSFTNTAVVNGVLQITGNTTTTNTASGTINDGVNITALAGGATVANAGTTGTGGLVFGNTGGTLTVNNTGVFNGFANSAAGTTTTVNNSGTWNYAGTSTLAGADIFNNTGAFRVASAGSLNGLETFTNAAGARTELAANLGGSIATFTNNATNGGSAGLGSQGNGTGQGVFTGPGVFLQDRNLTGITTFNNNGFLGAVSTAGGANNTIGATTFNNGANGVISLVNGRPTDTLTLTGNYSGTAGSVIALDVNLGMRQGDLIRINGSNNGQTTLVLNRIDNPNAALFSSQPVPLVVSGGGAGQVTLAEPIQGSGFATFELEQNAAGSFQIVSRLNTSAASGAANSISALITSLNVGFFQSVSAFIGAPSGNNNDEQTASVSVSSDPKMNWAQLNKAAAAQAEVAPAPGIRPNTIASGLWARGSGGNFTVRGTSTSTFAGGATVGQAFKVENSFAGMQVGIDTGVFNIDNTGWNLHLGITGGSVFADGTQKIGSQTTGVFDVPFIGVYGALTNGPFFSDLNYRHDFFNARISNQLAGLSGARLQIESNSVSGSSGYRFDFENLFGTELPYFIEPSGSMSYTNTSIGSLPVIGGTLQFRDIDSILGRFGLRFGTAFQATENLAVQPFVTGSVWHEFAGNTVSRFVSANIAADPNAFVPIVTDRVGTFGQVGVGVSAQLLDTPLLGYVRSDFRFGDKLEGYAVNGGIRYQF